jgi:hypothetical protein
LQLLGVIADGKCRENDEARMTKLEGMTKLKYDKHAIRLSSDSAFVVNDSFFHLDFVRICGFLLHSSFGFRHSVAQEPLRFQEKLESIQAACDTKSRR